MRHSSFLRRSHAVDAHKIDGSLRQRRMGGEYEMSAMDSRGDYILAGTSDPDEFFSSTEATDIMAATRAKAKAPHFCVPCCGMFSIFAILVLMNVGVALSSNSPYVKTPLIPEGQDKSYYASGVWGAVAMYFLTMIASIYFYWDATKATGVMSI